MADKEAEKAVLSILLNNPDKIPEVDLEPKDFFWEVHQSIFRRMCAHYEKGESFDMVSIFEEMDSEGPVSQYDGFKALEGIFDSFALESALQSHLTHLRGYSRRRQLYLSALDLQNVVKDTTQPMEDVSIATDVILQKALSVMVDKTEEDFNLADGLLEVVCELTTPSADLGLLSGLYELDSNLRGFQKGDLVILAGRPGMGKTALALNIAENCCIAKKSVLFFSLEMSKKQLLSRIVLSKTEIPAYRFRAAAVAQQLGKDVKPEDKALSEKLMSACDDIAEWRLGVVESSGLSSSDISKLSKKWATKLKGLDLIVIDYLGLIVDPGFKGDTVRMVSQITRNLKILAKDLEVPVLLLCQLNRGVEQREDKHPLLSDLRDSGSIEQDADVVLFTYRQGYYDNDPNSTSADVDIAKFRNGATCRINLNYRGEIFKFSSAVPPELIKKAGLDGLDDSLF